MTTQLIRNFIPKPASGDVLVPVDVRASLTLAIARWVSANKAIHSFLAGQHSDKLLTATLSACPLLRWRSPSSFVVDEGVSGAWHAMLHTSTLGMERRPLSWWLRSKLPSAGLIGNLCSKLLGVDLLAAAQPGAKKPDGWPGDILELKLPEAFDDLGCLETYYDSISGATQSPYKPKDVDDDSLSHMETLIDIAMYISLLEGIPQLVAKKPLSTVVDLGLPEKADKKLHDFEKEAALHGAYYLSAITLARPLFYARIFERFVRIPDVAKVLTEASSEAQVKKWMEAVDALNALPVPPLFNAALELLNPVSGADSTIWGKNTLWPYMGTLAPELVDKNRLGAIRREGGLHLGARIFLDLRRLLFAQVSPAAALRNQNTFAPGESQLPYYRELVQGAYRMWFRETSGTGITANHLLAYYKEIATTFGWRAWSNDSPISPDFATRPPAAMAGAVSDQAFKSSLDYMTRLVVPFYYSYGATAILKEPTDGSADRMARGVAKGDDAPAGSVGGVSVFNALAWSKARCHKEALLLWLTNVDDRDPGTMGYRVIPEDWAPLASKPDAVGSLDAERDVLGNPGPGTTIVENTLETWATMNGISIDELKKDIADNPSSWGHLMSPAGAPRTAFAYTSASVRLLRNNLAIRLPYIRLAPLLFVRDERLFDYDDRSDEFLVITPARPDLVNTTEPVSDRDLASVGIGSQDWVRMQA